VIHATSRPACCVVGDLSEPQAPGAGFRYISMLRDGDSSEPIAVLLAVGRSDLRAELHAAIELDPAFAVRAEVSDAAAAVEQALRIRPRLCLLESDLPGGALAAVWEITAQLAETRSVVLDRTPSRRRLLAALRTGARGYLPLEVNRDRLPHALRDVVDGDVAIPRDFVGRLVDEFQDVAPRRRRVQSEALAVQLTGREWQVVDLLVKGFSTAEIAGRLQLSQATIRSHIASALKKLGAGDREELRRVFDAA
jgi:DNA-binding NarL/FixJ family response regulator